MDEPPMIEVTRLPSGVALQGPQGQIAALSREEAVALAQRMLRMAGGDAEDGPVYQKPWG